jgi:hypothetical protein
MSAKLKGPEGKATGLLIGIKSYTFLAMFAASTVVAASAEKPTPPDAFTLTPDYRKVVRLDASNLSPFRKPEARAAQASALNKQPTGPNIAGVLEKFNALVLTGIIPSRPGRLGTIVLGGNIYREGEEIVTYNSKSRGRSPLIAEHRVVLRSVTAQALELSVAHAGDTTLPAKVPITLLEFRQR